ncbi:MAG: hypothetical protein ACREAW_09395, partial [Nitrososphaera sp.]
PAQAAGVFVAAAQLLLRRIIFIFWNFDDASSRPTFAELVIDGTFFCIFRKYYTAVFRFQL